MFPEYSKMMRLVLLILPAALSVLFASRAIDALRAAEKIQAASSPEPTRVTLADLLDAPRATNRHVTITDFKFGPTYVHHAEWTSAWIPVFTHDGRAALIRSGRVRSAKDMEEFCQSTEITGVVTNEIRGLGAEERAVLARGYPKLPLDALLVIDDRAVDADPSRVIFAITGITVDCVVFVLTLLVGWRIWLAMKYAAPIAPTDENLPPEPPDYGPLLGVFRERFTGFTYIATGILVCVLGLGAAPLLTADGLPGLGTLGVWCLMCFASLAALLGLGFRHLRSRLWVFERGLVRHSGGDRLTVSWDEVRGICNCFTYSTDKGSLTIGDVVVLRLKGDQVITLLKSADEPQWLAMLVQDLLYVNLHPRIRAAVAAGKAVSFGAVSLRSNGLEREDGSLLTWAECRGLALSLNPENGQLLVVVAQSPVLTRRTGPWLAIPPAALINPGILIRLGNELLAEWQQQSLTPPSP